MNLNAVHIRVSRYQDRDKILAVHRNAFGDDEGPVIASLVDEMLADPSGEPILSLAAELYTTQLARAYGFRGVISLRINAVMRFSQRSVGATSGAVTHPAIICHQSVTQPAAMQLKFLKQNVVCDSELGGHLLSYRLVA